MKLNETELLDIKGGATNITGTLINAVTRMFTVLLEVGRSIGSAIVRHYTKNYCL